MNLQKAPHGIEWARTFGTYDGWTWNPISGCKHECAWTMPDGMIAECYAKTIAERLAVKSYPNGFAHIYYNEKELDEVAKLKNRSGIFVCSMSDLMGVGVSDEWINRVIDVMRNHPQHVFYVLTKNPPRLNKFKWPENVWVGVSAPPTFMYGRELSQDQQYKWYLNALTTLGEIDVPVRWTSIEPLSWDVSALLDVCSYDFEWAVIGAASNGRVNHQPSQKNFERAFKALGGKPLFLKGNIDKRLATMVCGKWCEEFPMVTSDWRMRRRVVTTDGAGRGGRDGQTNADQ